MQSKSLLIAIAAFALTATGVQAYGGISVLGRAGLTEEQIEAFEEARELRESGDFDGARDKLLNAGITDEHLRFMHKAANQAQDAIHEAVENKDYEAFKKAVSDSPLADIVTSEADFEQFCEAHELRQANEWAESDAIMSDLAEANGVSWNYHHGNKSKAIVGFTEEQRAALQVARQANDRATIQAIFDEAGIESGGHNSKW